MVQELFNLILRRSHKTGLFNKCVNVILRFIRKTAITLLDDPLVVYELDGSNLVLPFSHDLPIARSNHPLYSTNIGRISAALKKKYGSLRMVDVGANVGDTVAIVRNLSKFPILCIDGNERFFSILESNAKQWEDVELERSFVGKDTAEIAGRIDTRAGTAHITSDVSTTETIKTRRLSDILNSHPNFRQAKLIKIDTDGFDTLIIRSEKNLLERLKPVIFFEYDPFLFSKAHDDGFEVFEILREIGYVAALFFENTGEYLIEIELQNARQLLDLHSFYAGSRSARYCDICVFSDDDRDVLDAVRLGEQSLAANR